MSDVKGRKIDFNCVWAHWVTEQQEQRKYQSTYHMYLASEGQQIVSVFSLFSFCCLPIMSYSCDKMYLSVRCSNHIYGEVTIVDTIRWNWGHFSGLGGVYLLAYTYSQIFTSLSSFFLFVLEASPALLNSMTHFVHVNSVTWVSLERPRRSACVAMPR